MLEIHLWSLLPNLLPEGGLLETLHPLVLGSWASPGLSAQET